MRLTEKVHQLLAEQLKDGDLAIDATAGNGFDTLFLADQVGTCGKVIAIDIQPAAIESTRTKLIAAQVESRVQLYCAEHACQLEIFSKTQPATAAAVVFNLGYLPGSDKCIQTQSATTERALNAARALLCTGGLLCVTAYRGHPGGMQEAATVENWMQAQKKAHHTLECHIPNSNNTPPILWVLRK